MRTLKETVVNVALTTICTAGLLACYGYLCWQVRIARDATKSIKQQLQTSAEDYARVYEDFCTCEQWLQECQLSIQSVDAETKVSAEEVDKIVGVHK